MEDFGNDCNEGQNNTGGGDLVDSRRPKSDGLFLKRFHVTLTSCYIGPRSYPLIVYPLLNRK